MCSLLLQAVEFCLIYKFSKVRLYGMDCFFEILTFMQHHKPTYHIIIVAFSVIDRTYCDNISRQGRKIEFIETRLYAHV